MKPIDKVISLPKGYDPQRLLCPYIGFSAQGDNEPWLCCFCGQSRDEICGHITGAEPCLMEDFKECPLVKAE